MSEWTKMRNALPANPKVIGMAQLLGSQRKLLAPLTTGFGGAMLEVVTLDVVVAVVVCGLLRVWGTANEVARDGVLKGVTLEGLDAIAHVPGFGKAMAEVGWARESKRPRGVELPNFTEFNVPVDSRAAERQRRYRERLKQGEGDDVTRDVTGDVTRHDRPDQTRKRLEEKPPAGGPLADRLAITGYVRRFCGLSLPPKKTDSLLNEFGLEPLVEAGEHFAARDPVKRWKDAENPAGVFFAAVKKAAEGIDLGRDGDYPKFDEWQTGETAKVPA